MLVPFINRSLSITAIEKPWLGSVIADLSDTAFSGAVLASCDEAAGYLIFNGGNIVAGFRWQPPDMVIRLVAGDTNPFSHLPETVAIEGLSANTDAVEMLRLFARAEPFWRNTDSNSNAATAAAMNQRTALLVRRYDLVSEMAYLEEGQPVAGYRFDFATGRYRRCSPAMWDVDPPDSAIYEVISAGALSAPIPEISGLSNPLASVCHHYAWIINECITRLTAEGGDKAMAVVARVLDVFRDKYPPLFKGVYINPETGIVNWEQLVANRSKVSLPYRYEKFPMYLDELLAPFVQALFKQQKKTGVMALLDGAEKNRLADPELDEVWIRDVYQKLDSLISKLI